MAISYANITRDRVAADIFAFMDVPAAGAPLALTNGVPDGARTLHLGATQGESVGTYTPTLAGVDIEQAYGLIGWHMVSEAMSIRATLVEPNERNIEMCASQGTVKNPLISAGIQSSFETDTNADGTADGWTATGTSTRTIVLDPATGGGTKAQRVSTGATPAGLISDPIALPALTAGTIVVLSGYAKATAATPALQWKLQAYDAAGVAIGAAVTQSQTLSTAYARNTGLAYTLPALTASVKIEIGDATGQTAAITVDNVQLEIVTSGSTPTAYVHNHTLFLGGKTQVLTFPAALVWQHADNAAKYSAFYLVSCYVTGGISIAKKRGQETRLPVEFMGIPDPSRIAGSSYGGWSQNQPS